MKQVLLIGEILILSVNTLAQNVGIGTISPGAKLHVVNDTSGYHGSYLPGAIIEGGTNTYINLLTPDANESGLLFGKVTNLASGGIIYNNLSTGNGLQFRTNGNYTRMVVDQSGNVGIGVSGPQQKLSVAGGMNVDQDNANNGGLDNNVLRFGVSNSGEAIGSGRTGGSNNQYGLDFYTASAKRMVIANNGNIGIGLSDAPAFKLDVADRIRIRSGGGFSSAGLYLNSNDNSQSPAFIGMEDDTHVGFWGSGVGWRFSMNTQTGALKINGSEGTPGQVLTSNGSSNGPPSWASSTNSLYNRTAQVFATDRVAVEVSNQSYAIPGLSYTFNVAGNAKVIVMFNVEVAPGFCVNCGATNAFISVFVDGNESRYWTEDVPNGGIVNFTATYLVQVGAGTHTIDLRAFKFGPAAYFGTFTLGNNMILQIIPE